MTTMGAHGAGRRPAQSRSAEAADADESSMLPATPGSVAPHVLTPENMAKMPNVVEFETDTEWLVAMKSFFVSLRE